MYECTTSSFERRSDLITKLGLRSSAVGGVAIPSLAPHYIIANFILSYALLSTRGAKVRAGLDHNVSPRDDLTKYGERAVKEGKLSQADLNKLKRREAAHANAVENFPFFVGALIMATQAKLPHEMVNKYALLYTVFRVLYAIAYAQITDKNASYLRSLIWWAGNVTCIRLFWFAGKALNGSR